MQKELLHGEINFRQKGIRNQLVLSKNSKSPNSLLMERNLIAREVNDLTSYIALPSTWLLQTPKVPPAKLDEETIDGYTCYVAIDIGLTDKSSKCRKVDGDQNVRISLMTS